MGGGDHKRTLGMEALGSDPGGVVRKDLRLLPLGGSLCQIGQPEVATVTFSLPDFFGIQYCTGSWYDETSG